MIKNKVKQNNMNIFLNRWIVSGILVLLSITSNFSQSVDQDELFDSTKEKAAKISKKLELNDDTQVLLHRAIYTYEKGRNRIEQSNDMSKEKKESSLQKIERSFKANIDNAFDNSEKLKQEFFQVYDKG